ncbi:hypothetical protein BB560_006921 [Smittium megazygosporum]|uniref:Peptide chain release factor domain-containing protein n=1 Tax=Smittium megazygosporum TaxID=133381 RepID=A0A2T9Y0D3_9FUNG|nr:hypothetical protein BB560_006921 [Smittium megazygosporum]
MFRTSIRLFTRLNVCQARFIGTAPTTVSISEFYKSKITPKLEQRLSLVFQKKKIIENNLSNSSALTSNQINSYSKELADIELLADYYNTISQGRKASVELEELVELYNSGEKELCDIVLEDIDSVSQKLVNSESSLFKELIPKDTVDENDVILEIRPGTGGSEASLFSADLTKMYDRYCSIFGYKMSMLSVSKDGEMIKIGSGSRSEKIRTYNYSQNRVTDHRINKSIYNVEGVLNGTYLNELIEALRVDHDLSELAKIS